jgi:hypothetical protein
MGVADVPSRYIVSCTKCSVSILVIVQQHVVTRVLYHIAAAAAAAMELVLHTGCSPHPRHFSSMW